MSQLVICANAAPRESYYLWDALQSYMGKHSITPVVLGWGQPWRGLGSKPKLLQQAIESGTIKPGMILFCDAFDVIFASPLEDIVGNADPSVITWNAEKNCFPNANLAGDHPICDSPFRYLNSGMSVGHTDLFLASLLEMKAMEIEEDHRMPDGSMWHANDQDNWMVQFLKGAVPMKLDTECKLFQTMCGVSPEDLEFTEDHIRNTVTGSIPKSFHFNGPAKTAGLREPVLNWLGF